MTWSWGLWGCLLSLVAVVFDLILEAFFARRDKIAREGINNYSFPGRSVVEIKNLKSKKRIEQRKNKQKRDSIFKYGLLALLVISNLLLTGGTIMSNEESSSHVTTSDLQEALTEIKKFHDEISTKVGVLEDAVFGPGGDPGGGGPPLIQIRDEVTDVKKELETQRRMIEINTEELEEVNNKLERILLRLDNLESPGLGERTHRRAL